MQLLVGDVPGELHAIAKIKLRSQLPQLGLERSDADDDDCAAPLARRLQQHLEAFVVHETADEEQTRPRDARADRFNLAAALRIVSPVAAEIDAEWNDRGMARAPDER